MRSTYPTARFLAIAACGEFTEPARDYVRSREVELFYISKNNIIRAFEMTGFQVDYPDNLPEPEKLSLVENLDANLDAVTKISAYQNLREVVGNNSFSSFKQRIFGSLSSMPQQIRLFLLTRTGPLEFDSTQDVRTFLESQQNWSELGGEQHEYVYDVVYSDGSEFQVTAASPEELWKLHEQVELLEGHMRQFG